MNEKLNTKSENSIFSPERATTLARPERAIRGMARAAGRLEAVDKATNQFQSGMIEDAHEEALGVEVSRSHERAAQALHEEAQRLYATENLAELSDEQVGTVAQAAYDRLDPKKEYQDGGDATAQAMVAYMAAERLEHGQH